MSTIKKFHHNHDVFINHITVGRFIKKIFGPSKYTYIENKLYPDDLVLIDVMWFITILTFCFAGGDKVRPYWERYYQNFQGIIFVVDINSEEEKLNTAKVEMLNALNHQKLKSIPLLIIATRKDGQDGRSTEEVIILYLQKVVLFYTMESFNEKSIIEIRTSLTPCSNGPLTVTND